MFDFQVPFHEQTVRYVAPEDEPGWATRSFGLHRVGWYSFARRGCMMRAFGPFGTETEAAAAGAAWMVEGVRGMIPTDLPRGRKVLGDRPRLPAACVPATDSKGLTGE